MRRLAACTRLNPVRVTWLMYRLPADRYPELCSQLKLMELDLNRCIHQEPTSIYNLLKEEKSNLYLQDKWHSSELNRQYAQGNSLP